MKTNNYQFQLMYQGQEHKDITYNETILKIDSNMNLSVIDYAPNPPEDMEYGQRYIISEGENKNKICYLAHAAKGVQYLLPHKDMIVFLIKNNCFLKFSGEIWQKITIDSDPNIQDHEIKFTGISGDFTLPKNDANHYLYLNGASTIFLDEINFSEVSLVVKQNVDEIFTINWPENILWSDNTQIQITKKNNAMDFFRFYKLPESKHFIVAMVSQNYGF